MELQTTTRKLRDMVSAFHRGRILLPQFQRDYVWKPNKIRNLLDSLLREFPIGAFYLWLPTEPQRDVKPKAYGEQRLAEHFEGYLIDGQQRLTSLEAAYGLYAGEDKQGGELRCYLDLAATDDGHGRATKLFVTYAGSRRVKRRVDEGDVTLVPLDQLFDGRNSDLRDQTKDALSVLPNWPPARRDAALTRLDRAFDMLDQMVPCATVMNVDDAEAVEVFARLNKGGTPLRQGDVRAAELARGKAVEVLKAMRRFVAEERPRRVGFGFSFAFRGLVVFHRGAAQFNSLRPDWVTTPGVHGKSLAISWRDAETAIARALEIVDVEMGWSRRALLPSANAVVVLAVALHSAGKRNDADALQRYRQWLCLTALRGVFQGSVETTINRFCRALRESKDHPSRVLLKALKRAEAGRIEADEINTYSQLWGPQTQVLHAWLVGQGAEDWISGEPIDVLARGGKASLPAGDLTVHHLFPRKVVADMGEEPREANSPANYALVSRSTNSELGAKPPDEAYRSLSLEQRQRADVQLFGEAAGDRLQGSRYQEFCAWRAKRLVEALNHWLGL